jgi:hypothetical protein
MDIEFACGKISEWPCIGIQSLPTLKFGKFTTQLSNHYTKEKPESIFILCCTLQLQKMKGRVKGYRCVVMD